MLYLVEADEGDSFSHRRARSVPGHGLDLPCLLLFHVGAFGEGAGIRRDDRARAPSYERDEYAARRICSDRDSQRLLRTLWRRRSITGGHEEIRFGTSVELDGGQPGNTEGP
jgi:hypothetical protein